MQGTDTWLALRIPLKQPTLIRRISRHGPLDLEALFPHWRNLCVAVWALPHTWKLAAHNRKKCYNVNASKRLGNHCATAVRARCRCWHETHTIDILKHTIISGHSVEPILQRRLVCGNECCASYNLEFWGRLLYSWNKSRDAIKWIITPYSSFYHIWFTFRISF